MRSQSKRYYSGCDPKLIRLSGDYLFKLNRDTYARASVGILERAFAGVERRGAVEAGRAELGARVSRLNYVAQRDFYSPFGFGYYDYQVATGHASLYWDTGWYGHRDAGLGRPLSRRRLGRHASR